MIHDSSLCFFFLQGYCVMFSGSMFSSYSFLISSTSRFKAPPKKPLIQPKQNTCNLFTGSRVYDDTYPIYQSTHCPLIDPEFNCQLFGRSDSDYLRYRWKPTSCELSRFNGLDFLVKMKGKSVVFVGVSLGRNQWESLICMILAAAPKSPTQVLKEILS